MSPFRKTWASLCSLLHPRVNLNYFEIKYVIVKMQISLLFCIDQNPRGLPAGPGRMTMLLSGLRTPCGLASHPSHGPLRWGRSRHPGLSTRHPLKRHTLPVARLKTPSLPKILRCTDVELFICSKDFRRTNVREHLPQARRVLVQAQSKRQGTTQPTSPPPCSGPPGVSLSVRSCRTAGLGAPCFSAGSSSVSSVCWPNPEMAR